MRCGGASLSCDAMTAAGAAAGLRRQPCQPSLFLNLIATIIKYKFHSHAQFDLYILLSSLPTHSAHIDCAIEWHNHYENAFAPASTPQKPHIAASKPHNPQSPDHDGVTQKQKSHGNSSHQLLSPFPTLKPTSPSRAGLSSLSFNHPTSL